jgi:hypothetical protein
MEDLLQRVRALEDRVLMLEAGHQAPLSFLDRTVAERLDEERWEPHKDTRRRMAAYGDAKAEAEWVGHDGPIRHFFWKLSNGEFDRHPRQNSNTNGVRQRTG